MPSGAVRPRARTTGSSTGPRRRTPAGHPSPRSSFPRRRSSSRSRQRSAASHPPPPTTSGYARGNQTWAVRCAAPTGASTPLPAAAWSVAATDAAADVTATESTLKGNLDPGGRPTEFWFQYGRTTSYGGVTPRRDGGSDAGPARWPSAINGLRTDTRYHYRLCASNDLGQRCGADDVLRTLIPAPDPKYAARTDLIVGGNSYTNGVPTGGAPAKLGLYPERLAETLYGGYETKNWGVGGAVLPRTGASGGANGGIATWLQALDARDGPHRSRSRLHLSARMGAQRRGPPRREHHPVLRGAAHGALACARERRVRGRADLRPDDLLHRLLGRHVVDQRELGRRILDDDGGRLHCRDRRAR